MSCTRQSNDMRAGVKAFVIGKKEMFEFND